MTTLDLGVAGDLAAALRGTAPLARRLLPMPALGSSNNPLAQRNPVGLLSVDIDPLTGELRGNVPQTCVQVGLILSAMRLSRSWEEGPWHVS